MGYQYNVIIELKIKEAPKPSLPMKIETDDRQEYLNFLEMSIKEMEARLSECKKEFAVEVTMTKNNKEFKFSSDHFPHTKLAAEYQAVIEKILYDNTLTMDLNDYLNDIPRFIFSPKSSPLLSPPRPTSSYKVLKKKTTALIAMTGLWEAASPSSEAASHRRNASPITTSLDIDVWPTDL